jgi:hypothetical protein
MRKNLFFLIAFCLTALSAFSECRVDTVYFYNNFGNTTLELVRKHTNTYDSNDSLISRLEEVVSNGDLVNFRLTTKSYYPNGKLKTEIRQDWDSGDDVWENIQKTDYTYDGDNVLEHIDSLWNGTIWYENARWSYEYNSDGNMTKKTYQVQTNNQNRTFYGYDTNGNQTSIENQNWSNNNWVNSQRTILAYNANNLKTSETVSYWFSNSWSPSDRTTYSYDASNRITQQIQWGYDQSILQFIELARFNTQWGSYGITRYDREQYFGPTDGWKVAYRENWNYNPSNLLSEKIMLNLNQQTDQLENFTKETFVYNTAGQLVDKAWYNWNSQQSNYVLYQQELQVYNTAGKLIDRKMYTQGTGSALIPSEEWLYFYNSQGFLIAYEYNRGYTGTTYNIREREEYVCSEKNTNISRVQRLDLQVYPNPINSGSLLTVNAEKATDFVILDMMGRTVNAGKLVEGANYINTNNMTSGVYFLSTAEGSMKIMVK